ncbi:hypothetical protein [Halosimplex amylolyticum]|uniref:hypothetical protein n=1 Tax=Halosimplex amylolyticum TaxID=3396616 RepID=UPI003F5443ED
MARLGEGPAPTDERELYLRVLLGVGVFVFVVHWLFLPPGWLWPRVPSISTGVLAALAARAGYRGYGLGVGVLATSAPGLALALRSEFWRVHVGCFPEAGSSEVCVMAPPDRLRYAAEMLALSVAFVLVACALGYGVGAGARRIAGRHRTARSFDR